MLNILCTIEEWSCNLFLINLGVRNKIMIYIQFITTNPVLMLRIFMFLLINLFLKSFRSRTA